MFPIWRDRDRPPHPPIFFVLMRGFSSIGTQNDKAMRCENDYYFKSRLPTQQDSAATLSQNDKRCDEPGVMK